MVQSSLNLSLYTTKAVVILDSEGKRIISKYYTNDYPTAKDQRTFERALFDKTRRMGNGEIILFDSHVIVYKNAIDVWIYFVGSAEENELILASCLYTFFDALCILLGQVEKRTIMENLDVVMLTLDETIDEGILLESDPTVLATRVTRRTSASSQDVPLSEQTISQALQSAKEQLARSLLK